MNEHIAHLREDYSPNTVCGFPWQGWQAPLDYDGKTESPSFDPIPHVTQIRQCPACLKVAMRQNHV